MLRYKNWWPLLLLLAALMLDHADCAIRFQIGFLYLLQRFDSLYAQFCPQLFFGKEFLAHVARVYTPFFDQAQRRRLGKAAERRKAKTHPVKQKIPSDQRRYQNQAVGDRGVFAGHRILRSVGNDHQHQDVGNADCADFAPNDEAEDQEQEPVHGRAAHDDFGNRHAQAEHLSPVETEQAVHAAPRPWLFVIRGNYKISRQRLNPSTRGSARRLAPPASSIRPIGAASQKGAYGAQTYKADPAESGACGGASDSGVSALVWLSCGCHSVSCDSVSCDSASASSSVKPDANRLLNQARGLSHPACCEYPLEYSFIYPFILLSAACDSVDCVFREFPSPAKAGDAKLLMQLPGYEITKQLQSYWHIADLCGMPAQAQQSSSASSVLLCGGLAGRSPPLFSQRTLFRLHPSDCLRRFPACKESMGGGVVFPLAVAPGQHDIVLGHPCFDGGDILFARMGVHHVGIRHVDLIGGKNLIVRLEQADLDQIGHATINQALAIDRQRLPGRI